MTSRRRPSRSNTAPASTGSHSTKDDVGDFMTNDDANFEELEPNIPSQTEEKGKPRGIRAQEANENAGEGKDLSGPRSIKTDVKTTVKK